MVKSVFLTYICGLLIFHSKGKTFLYGFFILSRCFFQAVGSVIITVPIAGNCGDDTVLTCQNTRNISYTHTHWYGLGRTLIKDSEFTPDVDVNKYTETKDALFFNLTIHNTELGDAGIYRCRNSFDYSPVKHLNVECKASEAVLSVTEGKKVSISVDKLHPSPPTISVSFRRENIDVTVAGYKTCSTSSQYSGYYRCVWSSNSSLPDGSYTYSIVVTTITQADPLTGSFQVLSPISPVVSGVVKLDGNRTVIFGQKSQSLTIKCTSSGGFPSPTLAWYKERVSVSNKLASTSNMTGILQKDGTYTVTLSQTFTPTITDDNKTLHCRSYYPRADLEYTASKATRVLFLLVATIESFSINGHSSQNNVTVFEHEADLRFICTVFPTATMKIRFEENALAERQNEKSLSFIRADVACIDAGVYTCEASDEYEHVSSRSITLFVICSPRPYRQTQNIFSSHLHVPLTLSFDVIAHPEPGSEGFSWFKEGNIGWIPLLSNVDLKIMSKGLQSNLTLLNVSKEDFGHYKVIAANEVGSYEQVMFVFEKEKHKQYTNNEPCRKDKDSSAMIVGVLLGILCLFQAICLSYFIIVHKRKCRQDRKSASTSPNTSTRVNPAFAPTVTEPQEEGNDDYENTHERVDQQYTELSRYANVDTDPYDELERHENEIATQQNTN